MPTKREREYYAMGYRDGVKTESRGRYGELFEEDIRSTEYTPRFRGRKVAKPKRKLSAWNKYVKANSNKPRFRYKSGAKKGKLNLKKMAVAFRKTPAGKKKRR